MYASEVDAHNKCLSGRIRPVAFSVGAGESAAAGGTCPLQAEASTSTVRITLTGDINNFGASTQNQVKQGIAQATGVPSSSIALTVAAGSVIASATMPSAAAQSLLSQINSGQRNDLGGHNYVGP